MQGDVNARDAELLYTVNLGGEGLLRKLRIVLAYESTVRGLPNNKTFVQLILEAVDFDSYPPELRERIDELAQLRAAASCDRALGKSA